MSSKNSSLANYQGLFQLPGLDPIVRELLNEWLEMARNVTLSMPSLKRTIHEEDLRYLDTIRQRFVNSFPDAPEIHQDEFDLLTYRSIRIFGKSKGASLLFPWTLFFETVYGSTPELLAVTAKNLTHFPNLRKLPVFIDFLIRALLKQTVPLTRLAARLLRVLVNPPQYENTHHGFPTYYELSRLLRCSDRSITYLMSLFLKQKVISLLYLVDMGQLGFNCWQVRHNKPLLLEFEAFTLRRYPLYPGYYLSTLYLPQTYSLENLKENNEVSRLGKYKIHWNLTQLHRKPEKSWKEPVRLLGSYSGTLSVPQQGISFSFTNSPSKNHLARTDFQILNHLQLVTTASCKEIGRVLGIKKTVVAERIEKLLTQRIALPYYNLNRIGLTAVLLLTWGDHGQWNEGFIKNILAYPYAEVFIGEKNGHALLKLPPDWVPQVLNDLITLREEGYDIWGVTAVLQVANWGLDLDKLAREYDTFFGWLWQSIPF